MGGRGWAIESRGRRNTVRLWDAPTRRSIVDLVPMSPHTTTQPHLQSSQSRYKLEYIDSKLHVFCFCRAHEEHAPPPEACGPHASCRPPMQSQADAAVVPQAPCVRHTQSGQVLHGLQGKVHVRHLSWQHRSWAFSHPTDQTAGAVCLRPARTIFNFIGPCYDMYQATKCVMPGLALASQADPRRAEAS